MDPALLRHLRDPEAPLILRIGALRNSSLQSVDFVEEAEALLARVSEEELKAAETHVNSLKRLIQERKARMKA